MKKQNNSLSEGDAATFIARHDTGIPAEELKEDIALEKRVLGKALQKIGRTPTSLDDSAGYCRNLIGLVHLQ